jgi:hypothetical protein
MSVKVFFVLRWLFYSAQYKISFISQYIISLHLSLSPSKLGRQSCRVAISQYMSLGETYQQSMAYSSHDCLYKCYQQQINQFLPKRLGKGDNTSTQTYHISHPWLALNHLFFHLFGCYKYINPWYRTVQLRRRAKHGMSPYL